LYNPQETGCNPVACRCKKGSVSRETLPFYSVADYGVEFIAAPVS